MTPWKLNRQIYNQVMANRHTDIIEDSELVIEDKVNIPAALKYLEEQSFPLIQPSKSRVVAIIYAKLIEKYFGLTFIIALSDPELLTDDIHFKSYFEDLDGYNLLLDALPPVKEWPAMGGWVDRTIKYFWLECMDAGVEFTTTASEEEMQEFLDNGDTPISL